MRVENMDGSSPIDDLSGYVVPAVLGRYEASNFVLVRYFAREV